MGLDMYLSAEFYLGDWDHSNETKERAKNRVVMLAIGLDGFRCKQAPSLSVHVNVAYWRKDNQIHRWFVENCQGGNDDCGEHDVSNEQLAELVALCEGILADHSRTDELPRSEGGCFFGSYAINDDYFAGLEATVAQLKPLLADERFKHADFHYRSSW